MVYEPDEGGYPLGYNPAKKLGTFDLSSSATNEPFRHLIAILGNQKVPWDGISDYRDFGFKAVWGQFNEGMPRENRYVDLNEGSFRNPVTVDGVSVGTNPMYVPDPNRDLSAQGKTFACFNAPFASVTIDNVDEASKLNAFLITAAEIALRAKSVANTDIAYIRWDIEYIYHANWDAVIKGRQVWQGGKYRHKANGGTNAAFKDLDDSQFFELVQDRWRFMYTELIYRTKQYSQQAKVWMYGWGPIGDTTPFSKPQFDEQGNISVWWKEPLGRFWNTRNSYNNLSMRDVIDYMEPGDFIPYYSVWAILQQDPQYGYWGSTDIIRLKNPPKTNNTAGKPTRYHLTDIGPTPRGTRIVKVSLHAQDGSLRNADKDYKITFQHWRGNAEVNIPQGQSSVEIITTSPDLVWLDDEGFLLVVWNTLYTSRYLEPTKLGFANWEPTPRTFLNGPYPLCTTDLFDQRIYDAMIAFTNLQNFGIVHWDANTVGKVNPMVRESLILAQKKIAPYKTHIENQTLVFTDVSLDNGLTWTEGGYPNATFQQRYNGWWMTERYNQSLPAPVLNSTYNAQQKTFLVAHLLLKSNNGPLAYKIRVRVPSTGVAYVFDITSSKNLEYSLLKVPI